jgi:hypothetical protein
VEELIIKKSGIKYHYILTYTVLFFENGDLSRKYHEKYMLIVYPWKKKRLSKKGYPNIYGCAAATTATGR